MGKKLQISVVKKENVKDSAIRSGEFRNKVFCTLTWFEFPRFKYGSDSQKKKAVKKELSTLNKQNLVTDKDLDKKELIIVTEQGNHGEENALFKGCVQIPQHLRIKSGRENVRARFRM